MSTLSSFGSNGTLFKIEIREGRDISKLSLFSRENEVLLPPNSTFRVAATLSSDEVQPSHQPPARRSVNRCCGHQFSSRRARHPWRASLPLQPPRSKFAPLTINAAPLRRTGTWRPTDRCFIRQARALKGLADGLPDNVDLIVLQQVRLHSELHITLSILC